MFPYGKIFLVSVVVLGLLDFFWLGFVMKDFNIQQLAGIARLEGGQISPLRAPALVTYLIMALALTAFAAPRGIDADFLSSAGRGALLGFCIYAIYDLTNLAILKGYPPAFAAADIGWGIASYTLASSALYFLRSWFF